MRPVSSAPGSALLVGMEDVVLCLHGHVARMPAVRRTGVGRKLVGRGIVIEQRVSPPSAVRKPLAVLFNDEGLRENIRHIDDKGSLDRKSTRLNSSHPSISYAVFCLKKKK